MRSAELRPRLAVSTAHGFSGTVIRPFAGPDRNQALIQTTHGECALVHHADVQKMSDIPEPRYLPGDILQAGRARKTIWRMRLSGHVWSYIVTDRHRLICVDDWSIAGTTGWEPPAFSFGQTCFLRSVIGLEPFTVGTCWWHPYGEDSGNWIYNRSSGGAVREQDICTDPERVVGAMLAI